MKAIIAGTLHERSRSFTPESMAAYEETKAYRDQSLVWVIPTRGMYPCEVVDAWDMIQWPMNQHRTGRLTAKGMEVASAYNNLFRLAMDKKRAAQVLGSAEYAKSVAKAKWIFTTEEDNIIPPYAVQMLFEAIFKCPDCGREVGCAGESSKAARKRDAEWRCPKGHKGYDGVSGLYSVKVDPPVPMAFGNPKYPDDFKPRSVQAAINTASVIEVNGIPQGCAIFRKGLFRHVSKPWFQTSSRNTQDLYFCRKAKKEAKARFAVHCGVLVGHLSINSGEVI